MPVTNNKTRTTVFDSPLQQSKSTCLTKTRDIFVEVDSSELPDMRTKKGRKWAAENSITYKNKKTVVKLSKINGKYHIAIYIRVSLETELTTTFDSQLLAIKSALALLGYDDTNSIFFIYQESQSAFNGKHRPVLQKMYDAVEAGEINIVVYHEVDRIARDVNVASAIDSIHQKTGVDIFIVPLGRFLDMNRMEDQMFFYNFAIMAQMYSKAISGKATNSQKRRSTAGVKRNSTVPYGLKDKEIVSDLINGGRKVFALDTDIQDNYPAEFNNKAAVVKEIYRKYNDGQSLKSIARWMNNTIPTLIKRCEDKSKPEVQTKSWDDSTIRYMLKNPVYFGGSHYKGEIIKDANGDFLITNEPLVTSEYWINTQALLDSNTRNYKKRQVRHTRTMSPLHYIARCSCGGQLKRSTSEVRGTPFYALKCIVPTIDRSRCSGVSISQIQLEKEIFEYTKDILSEPEMLNYFIGSDIKAIGEISISPEEQGLIDDIAQLNLRIDAEQLDMVKQLLITEVGNMKSKLNKIRMSTNIVINKVKSNKLTVEAFEIAWNSEDKSDVNAILATIYKSIIISKSTIGTRELNLLKKDGWHVDPKRVTLEHHDGHKFGLDDPLLV